MSRTVVISGMSGPESVGRITEALKGIRGLNICSAEPGMIVVEGVAGDDVISASVQRAGFDVLEII